MGLELIPEAGPLKVRPPEPPWSPDELDRYLATVGNTSCAATLRQLLDEIAGLRRLLAEHEGPPTLPEGTTP